MGPRAAMSARVGEWTGEMSSQDAMMLPCGLLIVDQVAELNRSGFRVITL